MYNVVCVGNSLTYGVSNLPPGDKNYVDQLAILLGGDYVVHNEGYGGMSAAWLLPRFGSHVQSHWDPNKTNIVIFWEGTNDIFWGADLETAKENQRNYCTLCQSNGWIVITATIIQRGDAWVSYPEVGTSPTGQPWSSSYTIERWRGIAADFNTWLRSEWSTMADGFFDIALADYESSGQVFNTPFVGAGPPPYVDVGHLDGSGYAVVAAGAQSGIIYALSGGSVDAIYIKTANGMRSILLEPAVIADASSVPVLRTLDGSLFKFSLTEVSAPYPEWVVLIGLDGTIYRCDL